MVLASSFNPLLSQGNELPMRNFSNTVPVAATGNTSEDYSELVRFINVLEKYSSQSLTCLLVSYDQHQ